MKEKYLDKVVALEIPPATKATVIPVGFVAEVCQCIEVGNPRPWFRKEQLGPTAVDYHPLHKQVPGPLEIGLPVPHRLIASEWPQEQQQVPGS